METLKPAALKETPVLCCICGKTILPIGGWTDGCNAMPFIDGRCCERCDEDIVFLARCVELADDEVQQAANQHADKIEIALRARRRLGQALLKFDKLKHGIK